MPEFITKTPIKFTATEITPEGEPVELTEKEAKPLLASGAIVRAKAVASTPADSSSNGGEANSGNGKGKK